MAKGQKSVASKPDRIQWHLGFAAAFELNFSEDEGDLTFSREYSLNRKSLVIDILVTKKNEGSFVHNEIGRLFKKYNVIEYKSARAALTVDDIAKTQSYAGLLKSSGAKVNEIRFEDVTVTVVRESKPMALFQYLADNHYEVINPYDGIYYIASGLMFATQIVVGRELSVENSRWLHMLSNKVTKSEMAKIIRDRQNVRDEKKRELMDAVLDISIAANMETLEELKKGDQNMYEVLKEIMRPEIDAEIKDATERVQRETEERVQRETEERVQRDAIKAAVNMLRGMNLENSEIQEALQKNYSLSEREALSFL